MKTQTNKNYLRFYTPHHFVYYPVLIILLSLSIYFASLKDSLIWTFISLIFFVFIALGLMLRQHYALVLQNRIVLLELRFRYFTLTGKRLEDIASQLNDQQLFSLRFASDDELVALTDAVLKENLDPKQIKNSIQNWKGDYRRV